MKKKYLILLMFLALQAYGQDSIVNYLDYNGKVTKKFNAFEVETIVKKDSLWLYTRYFRNRKVKEKGQYQDKNKRKPIGVFYEFFRNGKLKSYYQFDVDNELHGNTKRWFKNRSINFIGNYDHGEKIGIWKYYHYNSKIARKDYYRDTKLTKSVVFDEKGLKIDRDLIGFKPPKFKGGDIYKFYKRIKKLHDVLDKFIVGKVFIYFDIGLDGKIINIGTTEELPESVQRTLRRYLGNVEGWEPAIHMNRKILYTYTMPLKFIVEFR